MVKQTCIARAQSLHGFSKALILIAGLGIATAACAEGWSFTKVITVNHFGSEKDNDGFRPESFYFEKKFGESSRWLVGYIENSEGLNGPTVGYSYDFRQGERWDFYAKGLLGTNYKKDASTKLIPLLGTRYHLNKSLSLMLEGVYMPRSDDPYLLVITNINYAF